MACSVVLLCRQPYPHWPTESFQQAALKWEQQGLWLNFCCCNKTPRQKQLRGEGVHLACNLRWWLLKLESRSVPGLGLNEDVELRYARSRWPTHVHGAGGPHMCTEPWPTADLLTESQKPDQEFDDEAVRKLRCQDVGDWKWTNYPQMIGRIWLYFKRYYYLSSMLGGIVHL